MAIPLTRSGWLVAIGSVATVGAGRALAVDELFLLGAIAMAMVVLAVVTVRLRRPRLEVTRTVHPDRVQHRGASRVELHITNRGRRSSPMVVLHDPVSGTIGATVSIAPLGGHDHRAATYRLPTEHRGLVRIGPLAGLLTDPFGLARRQFPLAGETTLTVLPAIEDLTTRGGAGGYDDPLVGAVHLMAGNSADEDFATLRPYVVGDDLRRIHWSSSARIGDLLVRQDDPPWQGRQTIVFDTRDPDDDARSEAGHERFEQAVSATASLVHAAATRNDRVRLLMADGTDTGAVDARAGRDLLLEHLALVEAHPDGHLPRPTQQGRSRSGTLTVVTTRVDDELRAMVAPQRGRFADVRLVVIGAMPTGTVEVGADAATTPVDVDDGLRATGIDRVTVGAGQPLATVWRSSVRSGTRRR